VEPLGLSDDYRKWFDNWTAVASYFKDEPWVMYEPVNEPTGRTTLTARKSAKK